MHFDYDLVENIYFLDKGDIGTVLPKYNNVQYGKFNEGAYFGIVDIVASMI